MDASQKTGNYSVSINYALPWKRKEKPTPLNVLIGSENKKKKKTLRPIINPVFEKCANLTDDVFWKNILTECARGKFPTRGFTYKNGLLTYKKGNKSNRLEISDSPSEAYSSIVTFFQTVAGIMSSNDRLTMQQIEEEKLLEESNYREDITWKEIKPEKLKDIILDEFIEELREKMNFNETEKKELTTIVKKGFILKYFNAQNIIMEGGKILEIEGLIYNEKTNMFEIDSEFICRHNSRHSYLLGIEKDTEKPIIDFMEIWVKYLETLENKRVKKLSSYSSSFSTVHNEEDSESESKTYSMI